jgi:hypothetical protein
MPGRPTPIWGAALLKATKTAMPGMTHRQLLRLLWAINRIVRVPGPTWVAAAVSAARSHAGRWQPAEEQMAAIALQLLRTRLTAVQARRQAARAGVVLAGGSGVTSRGRTQAVLQGGSRGIAGSLSRRGSSQGTTSGQQQRRHHRRRRKQQTVVEVSASVQRPGAGAGAGKELIEGQAGQPSQSAGAAVAGADHVAPSLQGGSQQAEEPVVAMSTSGSSSLGSAVVPDLGQAEAVVESALTAADRALLHRLEAAAGSSGSSRGVAGSKASRVASVAQANQV